MAEKVFIQSNTYARQKTKLSCVRYGNVVNSRGSVIPLFREQIKEGKLTITDLRMTRFWITLEHGVQFVLNAISMMRGGEVFIPKISSMRIEDLVNAIMPNAEIDVIGIRPGEKLHETLITQEETKHTKEFEDYYLIKPEFPFWTEDTYWDNCGSDLPEGFSFTSSNNPNWLTKDRLKELLG